MATFDDVSALAAKNEELEQTMELLRTSRHAIQEQNQRLQILATEDPLTGCFNRRALFEKLESDFAKARRSALPLASIMVDIDHFKAINDNHGHQFGDRVIQHVAGILRGELRAADTLGRYGGEEFCVLLWNTPRAEALEVAERMRRSIASDPVEGVPVTASFGVALLVNDITRVDQLIAHADSALYTAKHSGRNRVVCPDATPATAPAAAGSR
jgi:diguanylate cyclase (GGDEF)-like protein